MIPLRDSIPSERRPYVTVALILLNALAWFYQVSLGPHLQSFVIEYGLVPRRVLSERAWDVLGTGEQIVPVFSHMFLHGGWLHVISNMWFLWIFGDNVEGRMGHVRFLLFYLFAGLGAAAAQTMSAPDSVVPMVGASGALSGVLGAYMLLFPHARVLTLVPLFVFLYTVEIPALVFLGIWIGIQVLQGTASIGLDVRGGVAWFAHIGGFVVGVVVVALWPSLRRRAHRQDQRWRDRRYS
jgi:membrane associated rhomboid family serine protease